MECAKKLETLKKTYEVMEEIGEEYRNRIIAEILIIHIMDFVGFGDLIIKNKSIFFMKLFQDLNRFFFLC